MIKLIRSSININNYKVFYLLLVRYDLRVFDERKIICLQEMVIFFNIWNFIIETIYFFIYLMICFKI